MSPLIPCAVQVDQIKDIYATTDPWAYGRYISAHAKTVLLTGRGGTALWTSRATLAPILFPDPAGA